ncbi:MAG: secreted hydrolase-like protein [Ramlibacter sp.]|nr:secreted hydrolase-like protein [Ramlibacter sp.]
MTRRRSLLMSAPGFVGAMTAGFPAFALPPAKLAFPRDHGAHPGLRTEWWYITGHASSGGREFGFQVTFFRTRVDATQGMSSRFAAKQLVFAHAAVTDVQGRKLWHDQRIAREGFDVALAAEGDARVRLRDWSLDRRASYYYSMPQLDARGAITLQGRRFDAKGKAWLDHEWSEELMHADAVGWDWIGMNLDDGSALTAFRLRKQDGTALWDGGSFRSAKGDLFGFNRGEVDFSPQRSWTSPVSKAVYPVEWIVRTPADFYTVKAVIDNQELDSRSSTGAIYWEGLSDLFDSNGKRVGRGYLEMTGYAQRLRI